MKEVIIIGGGVVGLSCAWYLNEAGLQVTILDKGSLSDGCSFGNAGMVVPSHFTTLPSPGMISEGLRSMLRRKSPFYIRPRLSLELTQWLLKFLQSSNARHVDACAPVLRDMHEEGKAAYKGWSQLPGFNFEWQEKGILMLYQSVKAEQAEKITAEKAYALGMDARILSPGELMKLDPGTSFAVRGGVHYTGDATFAPDVFMQQMILQLKRKGVEFFANEEINGITDFGKEGAELYSTTGSRWKARQVIVSAGVWSAKVLKSLGIPALLEGGKGYSLTVDSSQGSPSVPALLHEARVSVTPLGERIRIGGTLEISGLDNRIREQKIKWIVDALPRYYPDWKVIPTETIWYGYRPCTPDGMPYLGHIKPGSAVIAATGHAMMGISLAPSTGRWVRDIILKDVPIPNVLDITRY